MLLFWKRQTCFFLQRCRLKDFGIDRDNKEMPGEPASEVFDELWEQLEPAIDRVFGGNNHPLQPETQSLVTLWNLALAPVFRNRERRKVWLRLLMSTSLLRATKHCPASGKLWRTHSLLCRDSRLYQWSHFCNQPSGNYFGLEQSHRKTLWLSGWGCGG